MIYSIENVILRRWLVECFLEKYNLNNKQKKKVCIFIIKLRILIDNISFRFKIKYSKFIFLFIAIIVLFEMLVEILKNNSDKFIKIYNGLMNILLVTSDINIKVLKLIVLIVVTILSVKKYYRDRIRKSIKENYYKEVIEEYLNLKDRVLDIIYTNINNERILYEVITLNYKQLEEVSDTYKRKIFNYLNADSFNSEYKEVEKYIINSIPKFNRLKDHKFKEEELEIFRRFLKSKSRYPIICSINNRIGKLMMRLGLMSMCIIDKEDIIKEFMSSYKKSMSKILEYKLKESIVSEVEILNIIKKIDKKIGLYKKENSIYESFINKK